MDCADEASRCLTHAAEQTRPVHVRRHQVHLALR